MDARTEWLASLARDYADASDAARDDHEPAIEIPILDGPGDFGVWACCGGKRWHTDDCDQGPTPNQVLARIANLRIRTAHNAAADEIADRIERHGRAA